MLSEVQVAQFQHDGFLVLDDAFDPSMMERLRVELELLIRAFLARAGVPLPPGGSLLHEGVRALEDADHRWVAYIFDEMVGSPAFRSFHDRESLTRSACDLLGLYAGSPLYIDGGRVRVMLPLDETRTYRWHQEIFYTLPRSRFVQVWAPLLEASATDTGTIEVIPGSHVEGVARSTWNEEPGRAVQITVAPEIVEQYDWIPLELGPGQAAVLDGHIVHRSGSNTSGRVRYSLVGKYHDATDPDFYPPVPQLRYAGITPKEYHDEWTQRWNEGR